MNKKMLVILLTMIIAISACPQSSVDFNPNAGIVLQDMSFDVPKVYDDGTDSATLMFDVVNVGGKNIKSGVNVFVYGPTIKEKSDGATDDENVWRVKAVQNEDKTKKFSVGGDYITQTISSPQLPPPDPSTGISGGRIPLDFDFTPAKVLHGMEIPTKFYVSVSYPYETQTLTYVEVTSKNELRVTGATGSRKETTNAGGPIHITLKGSTGIRSGASLPLVFKIDNVGGGYPSMPTTSCVVDLPKKERDEVKVTVEVDGVKVAGCKEEVTLRKGTGVLSCTHSIGESKAPRRTYTVRATATYNYYTTSAVSITTVGTGET